MIIWRNKLKLKPTKKQRPLKLYKKHIENVRKVSHIIRDGIAMKNFFQMYRELIYGFSIFKFKGKTLNFVFL